MVKKGTHLKCFLIIGGGGGKATFPKPALFLKLSSIWIQSFHFEMGTALMN